MSEVITTESAALAYKAHEHESTLARYAGRLKFACCPICGREDGMDSVHRKTLVQLSAETIVLLAPWYSELENDEYLFHACDRCNRQGVIPDGLVRVRMEKILAWLNLPWSIRDPMAPDYAALAARWRAWAGELEAISWYDATLARKVAAHWCGPDSHPATLNALRQLREKYPDNKLLAALADEPEPVLASIDSRQSAGL